MIAVLELEVEIDVLLGSVSKQILAPWGFFAEDVWRQEAKLEGGLPAPLVGQERADWSSASQRDVPQVEPAVRSGVEQSLH